MDPLTGATTFATIVSLLGEFVSHRKASASGDYESFMSWLNEQRHDDVRKLLQSNSTTIIGVKALLNESRDQILEQLSALDRTMAAIVAAIPEFSHFAALANQAAGLSHQSLSVLEQFTDSGATSLLEFKMDSGIVLQAIDGDGRQIEFIEPRFIEDDLSTLVNFGLLGLTSSPKGARIFKYKRAAAALIAQRRGA